MQHVRGLRVGSPEQFHCHGHSTAGQRNAREAWREVDEHLDVISWFVSLPSWHFTFNLVEMSRSWWQNTAELFTCGWCEGLPDLGAWDLCQTLFLIVLVNSGLKCQRKGDKMRFFKKKENIQDGRSWWTQLGPNSKENSGVILLSKMKVRHEIPNRLLYWPYQAVHFYLGDVRSRIIISESVTCLSASASTYCQRCQA